MKREEMIEQVRLARAAAEARDKAMGEATYWLASVGSHALEEELEILVGSPLAGLPAAQRRRCTTLLGLAIAAMARAGIAQFRANPANVGQLVREVWQCGPPPALLEAPTSAAAQAALKDARAGQAEAKAAMEAFLGSTKAHLEPTARALVVYLGEVGARVVVREQKAISRTCKLSNDDDWCMGLGAILAIARKHYGPLAKDRDHFLTLVLTEHVSEQRDMVH